MLTTHEYLQDPETAPARRMEGARLGVVVALPPLCVAFASGKAFVRDSSQSQVLRRFSLYPAGRLGITGPLMPRWLEWPPSSSLATTFARLVARDSRRIRHQRTNGGRSRIQLSVEDTYQPQQASLRTIASGSGNGLQCSYWRALRRAALPGDTLSDHARGAGVCHVPVFLERPLSN